MSLISIGIKIIIHDYNIIVSINLIDGIYIVSISNGDNTYTQKVLINKAD